jgi:hypothetical protein
LRGTPLFLDCAELLDGFVPGAFGGSEIAHGSVERVSGEESAVEGFIENVAFPGAGALEAEPVLSDLFDQHGFNFGSRGVVGEELRAGCFEGSLVLVAEEQFVRGEAVFQTVGPADFFTRGGARTGRFLRIEAVGPKLRL